jgi:hypothetical protein
VVGLTTFAHQRSAWLLSVRESTNTASRWSKLHERATTSTGDNAPSPPLTIRDSAPQRFLTQFFHMFIVIVMSRGGSLPFFFHKDTLVFYDDPKKTGM